MFFWYPYWQYIKCVQMKKWMIIMNKMIMKKRIIIMNKIIKKILLVFALIMAFFLTT